MSGDVSWSRPVRDDITYTCVHQGADSVPCGGDVFVNVDGENGLCENHTRTFGTVWVIYAEVVHRSPLQFFLVALLGSAPLDATGYLVGHGNRDAMIARFTEAKTEGCSCPTRLRLVKVEAVPLTVVYGTTDAMLTYLDAWQSDVQATTSERVALLNW